LHGPGTGTGELDHLTGEEAAQRLAEQKRQHALLGRREERIRKVGGRSAAAKGRLATGRT
jgi:hypothetical protein